MQKLSIIISASSYIQRMKSYGPPILFKHNSGITLLEYQIKLIKEIFPESEIILISGLWADRVANLKTDDFRIVENQLFESTNEVEDIRLGLNNITTNNVLIFSGDMYFNKDTLINIPSESFVIYDSKNQLSNIEIGMTIVDKNATTLSFDLINKYTGIIYINTNVFDKFKKVCLDRTKSRLFLFEIINNLITNGIKFRAFDPPDMKILKINSVQQLKQYEAIPLI